MHMTFFGRNSSNYTSSQLSRDQYVGGMRLRQEKPIQVLFEIYRDMSLEKLSYSQLQVDMLLTNLKRMAKSNAVRVTKLRTCPRTMELPIRTISRKFWSKLASCTLVFEILPTETVLQDPSGDSYFLQHQAALAYIKPALNWDLSEQG